MNEFLRDKKNIEIRIDSNQAINQRLRLLTGYDESIDSLSVSSNYFHSELIDSIDFLKIERTYLQSELKKVSYSIDSLDKLK